MKSVSSLLLADFILKWIIVMIFTKMCRKTIYGLILLSLVEISCKDKNANSNLRIEGDLVTLQVKSAKETLASEVFDSLSYVVLDDSSEECLIGEVDKLECVDTLLFIMDLKRKLIHKYNNEGTFLSSIGSVGNGPGEYIGLTDFSVDSEKQEVLVLDRIGRRILIYDFDGNFLYKMPIEVMASRICAIKNGYALYTSGSDYYTNKKEEFGYNLFFYDDSNRLLGRYFPYNPVVDDVFQDRVFSYNIADSVLLYHQSMSDTIYLFKTIDDCIKLKIDFDSHSLPIEIITSENFREYASRSHYATIASAICVQDYLYINYSLKRRTYCFIYNKKCDIAYNISYLLNDMDETTLSMIWPLNIIDNRAYYLKSASNLLKDNKVTQMFVNGKKITEDSNPILVIGYLK